MPTVSEIRDAIKATLAANIPGLRVYDTLPDVANLPAAVVAPEGADFNVAMGRGIDTWEYDLFVLTPRGHSRAGQDRLDAFISGGGTKSIRRVIFENRSLGLQDVDAHVSGVSRYGAEFDLAAVDHYGAVLRLTVHTKDA